MAKFIHGDRVVHMIDVPIDNLDDFIEGLREQFGEEQTKVIAEQLMDELECQKKKK